MRTLKSGLVSILAIGLLAGSAVGVAGQDEEVADPMAPATFEVGFAGEPPADELDSTVTETEYGESRRGEGLVEIPFEAGDPRASGLLTSVTNEEELGRAVMGSSHVRIVNDDGAWEGVGTSLLRLVEDFSGEGPPFDRATSLTTLTGEAAYEGLTLIVVNTLDDWLGYIVPTELLPPAPALPAE